jgi:hypothetical protein
MQCEIEVDPEPTGAEGMGRSTQGQVKGHDGHREPDAENIALARSICHEDSDAPGWSLQHVASAEQSL